MKFFNFLSLIFDSVFRFPFCFPFRFRDSVSVSGFRVPYFIAEFNMSIGILLNNADVRGVKMRNIEEHLCGRRSEKKLP